MTPIDKVADHECMEWFEDIVKRAVCFDYLVDKKVLSGQQIKRVLADKKDIQEHVGWAIPAAIGLLLRSMEHLDPTERRAFDVEHLDVVEEFMESVKDLKRSEKMGPFSYAILS